VDGCSEAPLPVHYTLTTAQRLTSTLAIVAATAAAAALAGRVALHGDLLHWWSPLAALAGIAAADFGSGLVHWGADTWGRDDLPVLGHRLLVPFRIHHINPDDFLRRQFVDTNGEVAWIAAPVLLLLLAMPIADATGAAVALFGLAFCGIGMMTNQIHQWAHMPSPPRLVAALQDAGVLLGRVAHAAHHRRPYDGDYCITTGWCNAVLEALGFFRRLEAVITSLTGVRARHDDRRYEDRYGVPEPVRRG
jgi:ubiquitin-conjugating enzyme E2 variant